MSVKSKEIESATNAVSVFTGPELFRFTSRIQWVNKAAGWHENCSVQSCDTVAIDASGRICRRGIHFDETAGAKYPIVVYALRDEYATPD